MFNNNNNSNNNNNNNNNKNNNHTNGQRTGHSYCRDAEIVEGRDGLLNYAGPNTDLLEKYRKRFTLALARLD
eukprot:170239-Pyramimonas_sp.AAC.1